MLTRALVTIVLAATFLLAACASQRSVVAEQSPTEHVLMRTTAGDILLELDRERAPISTANFLDHAAAGHYDGTIFHRVIPTFVIQGGGYTPDLTDRGEAAAAAGKPDPAIRNEWQNGLKNTRGTIAMARETDPDSATRQFYINVADNARLDTARETTGNAGYAVFGRVIRGMEVVDRIKDAPTRDLPDRELANVPVEPVVITHVLRTDADGVRRRR